MKQIYILRHIFPRSGDLHGLTIYAAQTFHINFLHVSHTHTHTRTRTFVPAHAHEHAKLIICTLWTSAQTTTNSNFTLE